MNEPTTIEKTCQFCAEGNVAKDGWHIIPYDDPNDGAYRVSCINAKKEAFSDRVEGVPANQG